MAREREGYRVIMEDLLAFFDGKRLLSISDVARYCKCDRHRAKRLFDISTAGITVPDLARRMAGL